MPRNRTSLSLIFSLAGLATATALFFFSLAHAAYAASDVPPPNNELNLPSVQFWAMVLGAVSPLVAYVLNHYAPWVSERIKAIVQVGLAAAAAAIYQAISTDGFAFDAEHLQVVGSAIIAALLAHKLLYAPSTISDKLGGGRNVQDSPRR